MPAQPGDAVFLFLTLCDIDHPEERLQMAVPNGSAKWQRRRVHTFNTPRTTSVNITEILGYGLNNTEYLRHTDKCY
jgi:hypothetical protein